MGILSIKETHMQVPLLDLKAQYAAIKDDVMAAVAEVLESQRCIGGPKIEELEQRIAAISDCKYAVGTASGTDAILNSLMSLDIGPGDEVITTPFTFFATVGCIVRTGARPVFVDIDPKTYNIDPVKIESAITDKTKAIMPVHLFGQMADMDLIMEIAERHNLAVIEDAAQSITSTYKGKRAGSLGTAGCFSFFPSKNLGAAGDGGMIVTNDQELYYVGGNFRLDPIQAAVLLVKLPYLDEWSQGRRDNAAYYNRKLKGSVVQTPYIRIRVPRRDDVVSLLKDKDIGCAIYYPIPLHLQECFAYLSYKQGDFPHAEKAADEIMAIPVYPELTDEMKDFVADTIIDFLS
jgi:dTDP-4-amino-4,6-dideoxygalactose transaminase